jgi:predicted transcriptional regulator
MARLEHDRSSRSSATDEEDQETLDAIDRGVREADAGHLTPLDQVEQMLHQWISKSSSPTKR